MRRVLTSLLILSILAFITLQVFSLNHPKLSGDEAIGAVLFRDELKTLAFWQWSSLNPVLPYIGPADEWLQALPVKINDLLNPASSPAWILRLIPFLFYLAGCALLVKECWRKSKELGIITAVISLFTPVAHIHARIGWGPSLLLGTFFILWTEVLRMHRTGQVRWILLGALCGISLEFHPTSGFGIAILFFACLPILLKSARENLLKAFGGILIFLILAYPIFRHFPPPISGQNNVADWRWELRALFNITVGERPFIFIFGEDPWPVILRIFYFGFVVTIFFAGLKKLNFNRSKVTSDFNRPALSLMTGTLALLYFCFRGRALDGLGNERYLLVVVPGWIWLFSEFLWTYSIRKNWSYKTLMTVLLLFTILQGARFTAAMTKILPDRDPVLQAAEWLEKECPRSSCVAIAENFWSYWPLRFYTQDRVDINVAGHNWRSTRHHEVSGREIASCWYLNSREIYRGPYQSKITFAAQDYSDGQICFKARD